MSVIIQTGFTGKAEAIDAPRIMYDAKAASGTSGSVATGSDADWVTDGETWSVFEGGGASVSLTLELASAETVDYAALAAHNLGSTGASIGLRTSTDGITFNLVTGFSSHSPTDDSPIVWMFAPESAVTHVRFVFSGGSAAPQVAVAQTGEALELPRKSAYLGTPISESRSVTYRHQTSIRGDVLGRAVEGASQEFEMSIQHLPEAFRTSTAGVCWKSFVAHIENTGPFFVAAKPQSYPDDVAYARLSEQPRFVRSIANAPVSGDVMLRCMGYSAP